MRRQSPKKLPQSYQLEFSPSGKFIVALGKRVACWETQSAQVRFRSHPLKHPSSCAVHPAEAAIVVKSTSGEIVEISAENGELVRELGGRERGEGSNIEFSDCGEFLIDGSWRGDFIVRSAATGNVEFERKFPQDLITRVLRQPGTNRWLTLHSPRPTQPNAACAPDYFNIWEWPFTKPSAELRFAGSGIGHAVFSPDGELMCVSSLGSVSVFRIADGARLGSAVDAFGGTTKSAAWSPDGTEIAVVGKHLVACVSAPGLKVLRTISMEYASDVSYSPDGASIALGSWGSGLIVARDEIDEGSTRH